MTSEGPAREPISMNRIPAAGKGGIPVFDPIFIAKKVVPKMRHTAR